MNDSMEMNTVIEDSVQDSLDGNVADTATDSSTDTTTATPVDASVEAVTAQNAAVDPNAPARDEFAEKFGISGQNFAGRENRIPYSRVKKITEKAVAEAKEAVKKELDGQYNPRITDYETKVKDYEGRIQQVAQFEQIMANDPHTFLGMLSQLPAYKPFFDQLAQLANQAQAPAAQRDPQTGRFVGQPNPDGLDYASMPQPDSQLADGSMVYSMDGLAKRDAWLARQIEDRAVSNAEKRLAARYAPMEQSFQHQQQVAQIAPQIERQITEARTWDRFNELEPQVVQILQSDPRISLERAYMMAYQKTVVPKMASDRNQIRSEVIAELKKTPPNTSAPIRQTAPQAFGNTSGKRDLSDVIKDSLKELR